MEDNKIDINNLSTHPSKIFKFCPKCGSTKISYDGIKKFQCSDCNFIFYINAATATAVIIELSDGRIILTQRKFNPAKGKYDLPGGFVDLNERVEEAAIREVKEELNLDVSNIKFLASFPNIYEFSGITYFTCDIAFIAQCNDVHNLSANDDVQGYISIKPEEIDFDIISFESIRNILRYYLKEKGY